jgi:hypothetical protein
MGYSIKPIAWQYYFTSFIQGELKSEGTCIFYSSRAFEPCITLMVKENQKYVYSSKESRKRLIFGQNLVTWNLVFKVQLNISPRIGRVRPKRRGVSESSGHKLLHGCFEKMCCHITYCFRGIFPKKMSCSWNCVESPFFRNKLNFSIIIVSTTISETS